MVTSTSSSFQQIADILLAFTSSQSTPAAPSSQPSPPPPSLDLQPLLNSISSLNNTLSSLLPLIPPTSSLSTIQQTLSQQPTSADLSSIHLSLQGEFSKMLTDLHSFIPSAPIPQMTNLLNMCLTNLSGHILSRTADMVNSAVVAITKGETFTPPLFAQAGIIPAAAGPSAAPSSSRPASAEIPSALPPADPSTKLSLQMQKEELVKAGYDKDFISKSNEAQIASLLEKEAAKEKAAQPAQEPPPAAPEYLIRSWIWSPKIKKYVIRAESAAGIKNMEFDSVDEIVKTFPLSFLRQLFLNRCINNETQEELSSAHSLLGKLMEDKVQQLRKKKKT